MTTALLIVIVALAAAFVIGGVFSLRTLVGLRAQLTAVEKRLAGLQHELDRQEASLAKIRTLLDRQKSDPVLGIVDALSQVRSRGLLATLALVGVRAFRSYLGGRGHRKALPASATPRNDIK